MANLGSLVRDCVTGYEGVVVSRTEYLGGTVRIGLDARVSTDGKAVETQYFDEQRVKPVAAVADEAKSA